MPTSNPSKNLAKVTGSHIIPVIEERFTIDKRQVETGKVIISKRVVEKKVQVDVTDREQEVQIERVPINEYVSTSPSVRYEGDIMIIPVVREEVVVEKHLVLIEEIRVTTQRRETTRPVPMTLRKEEITIQRKNTRDQGKRPD